MCNCGRPTWNDEPGYRWNWEEPHTRGVNPPEPIDGDTLIYDEPGRCGRRTDCHCHHFRLFHREGGAFVLAVKHGGGTVRVNLHRLYPVETLAGMDSDTRYFTFYGLYETWRQGCVESSRETAGEYSRAIIEKRAKVRRRGGRVRVEILPAIG